MGSVTLGAQGQSGEPAVQEEKRRPRGLCAL